MEVNADIMEVYKRLAARNAERTQREFPLDTTTDTPTQLGNPHASPTEIGLADMGLGYQQ